jgi:chemotaxis protein CheZ
MTAEPVNATKEWKLSLLHDAVTALEQGDVEGFENRIADLTHRREDDLAKGVVRVATRLHELIHQMDMESQLRCFANHDMPDVAGHLDHVVKLTEQAAHRTLDLVDESRAIVNNLSLRHAALMTTSDPEGGEALGTLTDDLRGKLSALAQAQEYQDISGQLISRAVRMVRDVEMALVALLRASGHDLKIAEPAPMDAQGNDSQRDQLMGPATKKAVSQQDADALLADLGF